MYKSYKNIIWDFDGTLADTYPTMSDLLYRALVKNGINTEKETVYKQLKISMTAALDYFSEACIERRAAIEYDYRALEADHSPSDYLLFPDTINTLETLKSMGISNYMLTHRDDSAIRIARAKGMLHYFEGAVTKNQGFKRKPDPEAFDNLIEKYKLIRSETLNVGDRRLDIEAGHNASIDGCLIVDAFNESDAEVAEFLISDRKSLLEIVGNGGAR